MRAIPTLAARHGELTVVQVELALACSLSEFSEAAVGGSGDTIAGAVMRFEGPVDGTALLSMEPEHALAWVRSGNSEPSEIECFLELAQRLLGELAEAAFCAGAAQSGALRITPARLEEGTLGGALVATHAPSDTLVVAARLALGSADEGQWPATVLFLADAKLLADTHGAPEDAPPAGDTAGA